MKQDRFLLLILTGIGLLMILSIAIFLARNTKPEYKAEDTPSGVTHNFIAAIYLRDYEKAYSYMAEDPNKPDFETFRTRYSLNNNQDQPGVEIQSESIEGNSALVQLNVLQNMGGPFERAYSNTDTAKLVKQQGKWKIVLMPYFVWQYEWYQTPVKP